MNRQAIVFVCALLLTVLAQADEKEAVELSIIRDAEEMIRESGVKEEREMLATLLKEGQYDVFAALKLSRLGEDYILLRAYAKKSA